MVFIGTFGAVNGSTKYPIEKVTDGDTIDITMTKLPEKLSHMKIRVYGVDTPERGSRGQCAKERELGEEASKFTKEKIKKGKDIQFELKKWDKYGGRVLGDVIIDGKSLREDLIKAGLAREYYGDKKKSWCEDSKS